MNRPGRRLDAAEDREDVLSLEVHRTTVRPVSANPSATGEPDEADEIPDAVGARLGGAVARRVADGEVGGPRGRWR